MSLEFAVEYPCELRARYGEGHLRAWGRLASISAKLISGGDVAPTSDKVQFVENARLELEAMQSETAICASCPACLPRDHAGHDESVGCLGRISYPIDAQFEKFLADRVQLALDTLDEPDQPRLLRILVDPESPFDGEGTKELRSVTTSDGLRFFELRIPISLARAGYRLTTDHIFDLLAGFTSESQADTTYHRELPPPAVADYYDLLDQLLRTELSQTEVARQHARGKNFGQYLRLLAALERAEALTTRLLLD